MLSKLVNLLQTFADSNGSPPSEADWPSSHVARALRTGMWAEDHIFDRFLPHELRVVSATYWTPLAVAVRAAEWFAQLQIRTVVDIGSGAGKFCVAAALAGNVAYKGIEQRKNLVLAAGNLARVFGVESRVTFLHGAIGTTQLPEAEAYYLFNPFGENLFGPEYQLDDAVELNLGRYNSDIASIEQLLYDAPVGTHLLTYNGFGGVVPGTYREVRVDRELPNVLRMWEKVSTVSRQAGCLADAP